MGPSSAPASTEPAHNQAIPIPSRIDAARAGCSESFGLLAEHCRQYLLLIASGELPDDLRAKVAPSDLVQETLVRAQRGIHQFSGRSEAEFRCWIRQILLHYAAYVGRSYRQTSRRDIRREVSVDAPGQMSSLSHQLVADDTPPIERAIRNDEARLLQRALERLPPNYRRVLMLRKAEEKGFAEVGESLHLSADAARKLWARAVAALQREIKRDRQS
ncbi:sigma-70 family RNA polymerase sigma factor [Lacipirellula limnantheis]|uniref:RNA polymerase sigma factor n=1 Tax=Lacipirellula limnantheis TaxID=2528024 RepID=A0A517TTN8_9BACT|nr:sigma-70 family RNA polymerase sigma factor [Lacipirellula limnantheis]QDT71737.1 RNA polymerase sigma factor [Lacipirellula limnantheis]